MAAIPAIGTAFLAMFACAAAAAHADDATAVLRTSCMPCHGDAKSKGGVNFERLDDAALASGADLVATILDRLRDGSMPPAEREPPTPEQRRTLIEHFSRFEVAGDAANARFAGRTLPRRLTRSEFRNALRDLLHVDVDVSSIPLDPAGGAGFENDADTLFVSPLLLEKFIDASSDAIGRADLGAMLSAGREAESLIAFARRAFRRPLAPADAAALVDRLAQGAPTALLSILASPRFLLRIEADASPDAAPGGNPPISEFELAERLSFFVWSSIPDDTLFELAARGTLHEPATLRAQVRRMLDDPKSRALADEFAAQWFDLRRLETTCEPDPGRFPTYTPALRAAMMREVTDVFDALVRADLSLLTLIDADWTYANDALAVHYGLPAVEGAALRPVALTSRERGGVLGMAAILTSTSQPLRTSPVVRGKWVLETMLGTPPPPPPANAGTLPADDVQKDGLTLRQRLEQHRSRAECAACHDRIDPLGFALEGFDPIGRIRTTMAEGKPVDTSGLLPTGETVNGVVGLKRALLARKDVFAANVAGKMLAFALNRGLERGDRLVVTDLAARLAWNDYAARSLVESIALSVPFRTRGAPARIPAETNR